MYTFSWLLRIWISYQCIDCLEILIFKITCYLCRVSLITWKSSLLNY